LIPLPFTDQNALLIVIGGYSLATLLFFIALYRICRTRERRDIYELAGLSILEYFLISGFWEGYLLLWVWYLQGYTTVLPNDKAYYFGVWLLIPAVITITLLVINDYIQRRDVYIIEPKEAKTVKSERERLNSALKLLLACASAYLLGWFLQDRVSGLLSVWAVPSLYPLYIWFNWTFWLPEILLSIPVWIFTLYYCYFKKDLWKITLINRKIWI